MFTEEPVILADHVYKQYEAFRGISIKYLTRDALKLINAARQKERPETRFVLSDISFELQRGTTLGLIGHNGSGKTTLLRLLAGVSLPTLGRIRVVGRVQPLLALGAGFHNELTGRQNLYLNCTLMGLSAEQTRDRIEQIIAFSEIGEYIDVAIKRYSSGMLARLGFSAAIHMEPDLILLDEVMSVGDYAFSVKSASAVQEYIRRGTVVLVSHDLGTIERLCDRVIWLQGGTIQADGPSAPVVAEYTRYQQQKMIAIAEPAPEPGQVQTARRVQNDARAIVDAVSVHDANGDEAATFDAPAEVRLRASLRLTEPLEGLRIQIGIVDTVTHAFITAVDTQSLGDAIGPAGDYCLEARFPALALRPRSYGVRVIILQAGNLLPLYMWSDVVPRFTVAATAANETLHYVAPQDDLVYMQGASMRLLEPGPALEAGAQNRLSSEK